MYVIRPITHDDLSALESFSLNTSIGLTSLPPDRALLHQKILKSEHSFRKNVVEAGDELYQFALEDTEIGEVVGTCAIISRVGFRDPITFFRINTELKKCAELGFCKKHRIIEPISYAKGPSEVCTLYLSASHRKGGLGRLLSLCRFLFMASFPERFHDRVIAEMRGVIDDSGYSPFYEAVTRRFFDVEFPELQDLLAIGRNFINDLIPHRPIYVSLLPREAREVIGKTHPKTEPALSLLQDEGFAISSDIDLFDGGPKVEASVQELRSVKESVQATVAEVSTEPPDSDSFIISNGKIDFRACLGHLEVIEDGKIRIDANAAEALQIQEGDSVRYVEPRCKKLKAKERSWQEAEVKQ